MAIVGLISIVAAIPYARSQLIDWRSVWCFGIPGMVGTFIGAWFGGLAAASLQLVVFGGVLFVAAYLMLTKSRSKSPEVGIAAVHLAPFWKIAREGTVVGVITGFVGVGGGFLIVPALVVLAKLPMRLAVGTSLMIIAIKAAVGFVKYEYDLLAHHSSVDGQTILVFAVIGVLGSIIGHFINARLNQRVLQQCFAGFLFLIGGFVILHEGSNLVGTAMPKAMQTESDTITQQSRSDRRP